jgi:integrase
MSSAMKVSDFMLNLSKKLQEERKLADTTTKQYLQTLYKLNNSKPFKNLAWTKKFDDIQKIIDTYAKSTQGNQYMVLTSALSIYSDKPTYKATYNHWKDKMMNARKESDAEPKNIKTSKEEENWLTWEEVSKKKSQLKEVISSLSLTKGKITEAQYNKLLQYVILSLYTDIAPRRNQDYLNMYVAKKLPKTYSTDVNYYDMANQRFIFNKYKTSRTFGEQIINVPEELQETLKLFIEHHPLNKGKVNEFKLLVNYKGENMSTVNSITRILNRIFGKKVGSSMLRHVFVSTKFGGALSDMKQIAKDMAHSLQTQQSTYIKFD